MDCPDTWLSGSQCHFPPSLGCVEVGLGNDLMKQNFRWQKSNMGTTHSRAKVHNGAKCYHRGNIWQGPFLVQLKTVSKVMYVADCLSMVAKYYSMSQCVLYMWFLTRIGTLERKHFISQSEMMTPACVFIIKISAFPEQWLKCNNVIKTQLNYKQEQRQSLSHSKK